MGNTIIQDYFNLCKTRRIEKFYKKHKHEKEEDLENMFTEESFEEFVIRMSKLAKQRTFVTHPAKYTHTALTANECSSIIANCEGSLDGYVRTGNTQLELDSFGRASALEVDGFLRLIVDNKMLLEHIIEDTEVSKELFGQLKEKAEETRMGFLVSLNDDKPFVTSSLAKQILFPINTKDLYVNLTILRNSSLMYKAKSIIKEEEKRNSELYKLIKDKKYSSESYFKFLNITEEKLGGSNPQNVSAFNSRCAGTAYLFPSLPPKIKKREIRIPSADLFAESIRLRNFKDLFLTLQRFFKIQLNNIEIREFIEDTINNIIDLLVLQLVSIRYEIENLTFEFDFSALNPSQKMLLLCKEERFDSNDWLTDIVNQTALWIVMAYKTITKKEALPLADAEFNKIKKLVDARKENFYL